jgi:hypothetical protein
MGLLRLINASRLAPLEELLAELKSGAPSGSATSGVARGAATATAFAAAPKMAAPIYAAATPAQPKTEARAQFPSPFAVQAAATVATAAAPADANLAAEPQETKISSKSNGATAQAIGISQEQVAEIKAAIHAEQKFLGQSVEKSSRWELDGAELRIYFPENHRTFAEWFGGRESLEKIRTISSKVLGRSVRVCAKLEAAAGAAASAAGSASGTQELRAKFERDPLVRSMLQRFGGRISEVKRGQEES